MNLALLFTSYRQFEELDLQAEFMRRASRIPSSVPVIYHNNNGKLAPSAISEKLAKIPAVNIDFIHSPQKNAGGYPYGQFEAILDVWDKLSGYDWVIHLHPDIFIVDESRLLEVIGQANRGGFAMVVTPTFGLKAPSFATDFFAFRPSGTPRGIFESFLPLQDAPIVVPLEDLFYIEVHRAGVKYMVAHRFAHGHYHRDIDQLGLWHEHDLNRVRAYLRRPGSRWPFTLRRCLSRPYLTLRYTLNWWNRRRQGIPQDSLPQQLTAL
jgi:hypothetical protein